MRLAWFNWFIATSLGLVVGGTIADGQVRAYKSPDYRKLGVYGGGLESDFDYQTPKVFLEAPFPGKREYWNSIKASRATSDGVLPCGFYMLSCGERTDSAEAIIARVDAWLESTPDAPTYPELIPAVTIGEENTLDRTEVLDTVARHIRDKYGIPVLQWYSDPLPPSTSLTADGWVWDSYGRDEARFRRHVQKFVALGKPAICVAWATDPHWPQWKQYPTAEALFSGEWHQLRVCSEFNLSCAMFAVAGKGSYGSWRSSPSKEMILLRNALRVKRAEAHSFAPGQLPLPTANFSARAQRPQVGGPPESPTVYQDDFSGFRWIDDADIQGFLNLKLSSRPDTPGFLLCRTEPDQRRTASLIYAFKSYFPIESVKITLDSAAPSAARSTNVLAIKTDEVSTEWPLQVTQQGNDECKPLELQDAKLVKGQHEFYVRVTMENLSSHSEAEGNRLDSFRVECTHLPPGPNAAAKLMADEYGNLTYDDNFATERWRYFGDLYADQPSRGGFRANEFWVGGAKGAATGTRLVQRFSSDKPLTNLTVEADCFANAPGLGGRVTLEIAPRGGKPIAVTTSPGMHRGVLRLEVPSNSLRDLLEFDLIVTLSSSSGVDRGANACATVNGLRISAN